jgi:hypothetical protein
MPVDCVADDATDTAWLGAGTRLTGRPPRIGPVQGDAP